MSTDPQDHHLLSTSQISLADPDEENLSPLEQEVLDEYARLLGNLNTVCIVTSSYFPPSSLLLFANSILHSTDVESPLVAFECAQCGGAGWFAWA